MKHQRIISMCDGSRPIIECNLVSLGIGTMGKRKRSGLKRSISIVALLSLGLPTTMAQNCIPLKGSTQCPAFNQSSFSTSSALTSI